MHVYVCLFIQAFTVSVLMSINTSRKGFRHHGYVVKYLRRDGLISYPWGKCYALVSPFRFEVLLKLRILILQRKSSEPIGPKVCKCKGADKSHDGILDFYELLAPGTGLGYLFVVSKVFCGPEP